MWVSELGLTNFRNYRRLGLELEPGVAVFCGRNGEGKSNLLEAAYVLATTKSPRTSAERELLSWLPTQGDPAEAVGSPPFARLEARVRRGERGAGEAHLEMLFRGTRPEADLSEAPGADGDGGGDSSDVASAARRRVDVGLVAGSGLEVAAVARSAKVNGIPTRAAGLLGQLRVVYFAPDDVALAGGPPAGRRRYLDLANSQVAALYLRALQQYNRILLQRNSVLRQVRERRQALAALEPWTEQLTKTGVFILRHRLRMLAALSERARGIFGELVGSGQELRVVYRSTIASGEALPPEVASSELARLYRARQEALAAREVEQAATLVGPHRDDFAFLLDGVDLHAFGSRGQQRLAVVALKLAEADWMRAETGELPVLLLDDVLSELDPARRRYVLQRVAPGASGLEDREEARQVWITTTDFEAFQPRLLERAQRFEIEAGTVRGM